MADDGGSITVDGGVAIVTGPTGLRGRGELALVEADGGVVGEYIGNAMFWLADLGCALQLGLGTAGYQWFAENWAQYVAFETTDCTGQPYAYLATGVRLRPHCIADQQGNLFRLPDPIPIPVPRTLRSFVSPTGSCQLVGPDTVPSLPVFPVLAPPVPGAATRFRLH